MKPIQKCFFNLLGVAIILIIAPSIVQAGVPQLINFQGKLIEDDVSILHEVTLGGTGNVIGDRHPKVRKGVLIGAGAKILGNVEIGEYSKIAASSVVLTNIPPHSTAAGVPAQIIGKPFADIPSYAMNHQLNKPEE